MIPARPPCFGLSGLLRCNCAGKPTRSDCVSARYFWITAETIAGAKDDATRKIIVDTCRVSKNPIARKELREAAWSLIKQPAQGDLLAAA